jgi:hypothetical protein
MRRRLGLLVVALLVAGCSAGATPSVKASTATPVPTFTPLSQPFRMFTHCGILTTYSGGQTFYLVELHPARVSFVGNPGDPMVAGTMTLLSPHVARFTDQAGNQILFVDQLPGALNIPYPYIVRVLSGANALVDERFAGRHWHTTETPAGRQGSAIWQRAGQFYGSPRHADDRRRGGRRLPQRRRRGRAFHGARFRRLRLNP